MEAESHEPEVRPSGEITAPDSDGATIAWANIFYGMLVHPATTLKVLANPQMYKADAGAFFGVLAVVVITSIIESFAQAGINRDLPLAVIVGLSFVGDLVSWFAFSLFLTVLVYGLRRQFKIGEAFIVCGWAFVPLIFKAPIFALAVGGSWVYVLFGLLSTFWFTLLQLFAYDALLKAGRWKTIALSVLAPPVLFTVWMCWFWLGFAPMLAVP